MNRKTIELLWQPADRPTRGPKPALSTRRIADAAIAIADADGLAALSMQRVAADLNFTKMSLYRYFPGKAELLAVMIDTALGEPPDGLPSDWRAGLTNWAHQLWARYERHPWLLHATIGHRVLGPNELGWLEAAVATLTNTGLPGGAQLDAVFVVSGHIRNVAQQAVAGHSEERLGSTIAELLANRTDRFPALAAAMADVSTPDNALDYGLARILDGIASQLR